MGYAYPIDSKVVTNPNGTIDYDRASSSAQLRGLIKSMITNGVNLTESTNLQVMADEGTMNVIVKPGYVIIEGALKHFEEDVKVKISNADASYPRIDTVVARLNLNEDVRDIVIDVLQGTPSANPTAPELSQNTSTYYEVGLADILVEAEAEQISQDVITDTRLLNSRCGMISAIGEIDTETLFVQLTTDFNNWFESIKGQLGDDIAGSLQMQITDHRDSTVSSEEGIHGIRYFENALGIYNEKTKKWDNFGIPPRPVSQVNAIVREFVDGYKEVDVNWVLGETYDSQTKEIHVYGYKGENTPSDFEEFNYLFSVEKNTISAVEVEIDDVYTYILVAPVSTEGVIQKELTQMCKATIYKNMPIKGTTFADASWSDISSLSQRGLADYYFNVGDEKTISVLGTNYKIVICGMNHDKKSNGTTVGLTMALLNCLISGYSMSSDKYNWNGWSESYLRTQLNDTIITTLPEELKAVIKPVVKKSDYGGWTAGSTSIRSSTDSLWLFTQKEVLGTENNTLAGQGTQYSYFANNSRRIKSYGDSGSATTWWLRSSLSGNDNNYQTISSNGNLGSGGANGTLGVCFGFCV